MFSLFDVSSIFPCSIKVFHLSWFGAFVGAKGKLICKVILYLFRSIGNRVMTEVCWCEEITFDSEDVLLNTFFMWITGGMC